MSYLVEFPASPLPQKASCPPYVLFGINGQTVAERLPLRIPLNVVTHFAPKLKQWILPPPSTTQLPWNTAKLALRTPHVGIDLRSNDVEFVALHFIICRMLQLSGVAHPKSLFLVQPNILESVSIHKTWLSLGLPFSGLHALHMYVENCLSLGPPVTFPEIVSIWRAFSHTSPIVRAMGVNFIQSHVNLEYKHVEVTAIRNWYLSSEESYRFFVSLENEFPAFAKINDIIIKAMRQKIALADLKNVTEEDAESTPGEGYKTQKLEIRNLGPAEVEPQKDDLSIIKRPRPRRSQSEQSMSSVETAIWKPSDRNENVTSTSSYDGNDSGASSESRLITESSRPTTGVLQQSPTRIGAAFKRLLDRGAKYRRRKTSLQRDETLDQLVPWKHK